MIAAASFRRPLRNTGSAEPASRLSTLFRRAARTNAIARSAGSTEFATRIRWCATGGASGTRYAVTLPPSLNGEVVTTIPGT